MPSSRPRGAKYRARRQDIVDTAARLFAQNGYAATGISDIGDAVDLARGALYYYIGSKESLLAEIHDRVLDPLLEQTSAIIGLDATPTVKLRLISEVLLRQIIERQDHVWVFLHEYRSLTGEPRQVFRDKREQFERRVSDLIAEGAKLRLFLATDIETTTLAFLGMHNYTYQWIRTRKAEPAELSEAFCKVFFSGIVQGMATPYSTAELKAAKAALALRVQEIPAPVPAKRVARKAVR